MKRQRILKPMIGVMTAALAGLIVLQYILLSNAYELKEQTFNRAVYNVLGAVVSTLERHEAASRIVMTVFTPKDSLPPKLPLPRPRDPKNDGKAGGEAFRFMYRRTSSFPRSDTIVVSAASGCDTTVTVRAGGKYTVGFTAVGISDSLRHTVSSGGRERLVSRVVDDLLIGESVPIARRIGHAQLDSTLHAHFRDAGIDLPFVYAVETGRGDSISMTNDTSMQAAVRNSEFRSRLFPNDLFAPPASLAVAFPSRQSHLLGQMLPMLAGSLILTSIVIIGYVLTLRMLIRQRRFAARMTEFINNMTHEFKTPISTIALASETALRPEVQDQRDKTLRYHAIIRDELTRMRAHVEKILHMALLEEGEIDLRLEPVDLNEAVVQTVNSFRLRVEGRGGTLRCSCPAEPIMISADRLYVANVLQTLLDNADKYSPETPVIEVTTRLNGGSAEVSIADRGIGIAPEEQQSVFEKYYRVSTGNRHDVKGFGLGLTFVKWMMEAHGGSVSLTSEPGRGTTILLTFPPGGTQ